VGADHGKGAMRVGGKTVNYYSPTGASIGLQAGGQSRSVIYVFNTADALQKFRASNGWTADADATVAIGTVGANGHVDSKTAQHPIASFALTNVGLEAGVSLGGSKITPITLP
jgi:lipid-binding SYLF domain-containing protein